MKAGQAQMNKSWKQQTCRSTENIMSEASKQRRTLKENENKKGHLFSESKRAS